MWYRPVGFLVTLTLSLYMAPLVGAQPQVTLPRIGVLLITPPTSAAPRRMTLAQALHERGYVEGQHIAFERRFADTPAQIPALVAELVGLKVDVLVVQTTTMALAAKQATSTIPIVVVSTYDPMETGLVASLARPGGNVTGLTTIFSETSTKALELLKEAIPGLTRVAVFRCLMTRSSQREWEQLQGTAQRLGVQLQPLEVQSAALGHIEALFATAVQEQADALQVLDCMSLVSVSREQIASLAARHRLPAVYPWRSFVVAGGLMSYGPDLAQRWPRAAVYVEKLLKGATPADLPVEQPIKFELLINLKTAAALGLTIPPTLLFQADEVIQ